MLKEGNKAPDFTLASAKGDVTLSALLEPVAAKSPAARGKGANGPYVVLYFYPKDKTPGCTREGQAFSALESAFAKAGARVFGISKDTVTTHASFATSCSISVPLLSDPDLVVHKAYGAYGEKTMYGKKVLGTIRSTFVVGPDGKLVTVFPNVKVDGHAEVVLRAIVEHSGGSPAKAPRPKAPAKRATAKPARAKSAR